MQERGIIYWRKKAIELGSNRFDGSSEQILFNLRQPFLSPLVE